MNSFSTLLVILGIICFIIVIVPIVLALLILIIKGDTIQKRRCERFRREQLEKGIPDDMIDLELLSSRFML